ncbi:MAG: hypothetical protein U5K71_10150 [Gracilimonas sp.]|nr:hypothetical protein [Gracilimonas sp.]
MDINFAIFWEPNLTVGAHYSLGLQRREVGSMITYETDNQTYPQRDNDLKRIWLEIQSGLTRPLYRQQKNHRNITRALSGTYLAVGCRFRFCQFP